MSYHNLCLTTNKAPDNIGDLLGLGLKFCIQSRRPDWNSIEEVSYWLQRDVRLWYIFAESDDLQEIIKSHYSPKLYIKSKWTPPLTNSSLEGILTKIKSSLEGTSAEIKSGTRPSTNITPAVENIMSSIMMGESQIVLATDKNLGPAIIDRATYIKGMLTQHLLDGRTYQQLDYLEANTIRQQFLN